jgi:two-component system, NtrC family, response regulator AtoC
MTARILIADDEISLRKVLAASLRREGYEVVSAQNGTEALQLLKATESPDTGDPFDLVISDVRMPGIGGIELLSRVKKRYPDLPVVMLTAHGTVDMAVQALKVGAFDFVTKPYERDEFHTIIRKALDHHLRDLQESRSSDPEGTKKYLVGESEPMRAIINVIEKVADTPSTVLITGESGTGKELVALALHQESSRKDEPFIRINCGAIPPTLIEAELFGHEKGAFTGAIASKPGRFELADNGTLLLDEIGDLPLEMQVKVLRALQESTFERVGGVKSISVNVRLIAATNKDLQKAIAEGQFRDDLFYRLNVVPVELPPLRNRKEDIPLLAANFLEKFNERLGRSVETISVEAMNTLTSYSWPGNIRELENIIERTMLFSDSPEITVEDLPPEIVAQVHKPTTRLSPQPTSLQGGEASMKEIVRQATMEIEHDLILQALEETGGNVTHAARKLKISRKSLQIKMKELGIRDQLQKAEAKQSLESQPPVSEADS